MLRNGIKSGPFLDRCQLLVDLRGDNMELPLAVIGHQFNLVNLALQHIQNRINRRGRRRRREGEEEECGLDHGLASGGAPERGPRCIQELHEDAPRDVR